LSYNAQSRHDHKAPDGKPRLNHAKALRSGLVIASGALLLALAGCTVQPLYSAPVQSGVANNGAIDASAAASMSMQSTLSTVAVGAAATKRDIIVRNRLIFLLGQGRGEPSAPAYRLTLVTSGGPQGLFDRGGVGTDVAQPSAQLLALTGQYTLSEVSGGAIIVRGSRSATAAYDVSSQAFSERAALADAEERAGTELAEMIHLAVAQALASR
jgi:LPS-assembly lipoprotein